MKNKVFNENCLDTMARMPDGYIDLTVTSPPYDNLRTYDTGIGDEWNFEIFKPIARELYRVTKPGGVVVWVVADATVNGSETGTSFRQALYFKDECGFNLHDTMIYKQNGTGAKGSNLAYWQAFEYVFILSKGRPKSINLLKDKLNKSWGRKTLINHKQNNVNGTRKNTKPRKCPKFSVRDNIWIYDVGFQANSEKTTHPAIFPEQLATDHILSWSTPGDIVYDPFAGSGTTLKMAYYHDRKYIGSEISAEYCDIIHKRLRPLHEQAKLF